MKAKRPPGKLPRRLREGGVARNGNEIANRTHAGAPDREKRPAGGPVGRPKVTLLLGAPDGVTTSSLTGRRHGASWPQVQAPCLGEAQSLDRFGIRRLAI